MSAGVEGGPGRGDVVWVVVAFALVYVVWGSTYLAIAWAIETIPPFSMIGARCLIAGAVLYGWARWRGAPRPTAADWRGMMVTGTLLFGTGQAVLAWAETRVASGPAALLIATEPLFVVLLGWWGGRLAGSASAGTRPSARTLGAIAVGFVGVALMVLPMGENRLDPLGVVAILGAAFSWSLGLMRARPRPGLTPVQVAGMQLLAGSVSLAGIATLAGEPGALVSWQPSARSLGAFAYLVVFGSIVTYAAYVWLLDRVGPERLSTHAYVNPVVAVALGVFLGGEAMSGSLVAAMALILGSVVVLVRPEGAETRRPRRRRLSLKPAAAGERG